MSILKTRKKLLLFIITLVFLLFSSFYYHNKVFSLHFVDEEENLVLAKYLLKGEILYSDLFSTHQPLPYIFSTALQKVTQPNSLYLLIKRHREAIIIYSIIWSIFLVMRFGVPLFLFVVLYELTKIYFLGNLFLGESLAVYPLVYISNLAVFNKYKLKQIEIIFIGFCLGLIIFLLSPLWPLVLFLVILLLRNQKVNKVRYLLLLFVGILPVFALTLNFLSLANYFYYPIYTNLKYFIPIAYREPTWLMFLKSLLTPLIAFWPNLQATPSLLEIRALTLIFLTTSFFLLKKKNYSQVFVLFLILGLANTRFVIPGQDYYSGFHLLPWFALLILFSFVISDRLLREQRSKLVKFFLISAIILPILLGLRFALESLFTKQDLTNDFFISYTKQKNIGDIVKILKKKEDKLMVIPDQWLVYWQADISHGSKMLDYYAWMQYVPYLKAEIDGLFYKNPPVFFYCDCLGADLKYYLETYPVLSQYREIKKDGSATRLFVDPKRLKDLGSDQINLLNFHNIEIN